MKATISKIRNMERVSLSGRVGAAMKENTKMMKEKVMGRCSFKMDLSIKENGLEVCSQEEAQWFQKTVQLWKAISKTMSTMEIRSLQNRFQLADLIVSNLGGEDQKQILLLALFQKLSSSMIDKAQL